MVTLKQMRNALDAFIRQYGDKELVTIGVFNGRNVLDENDTQYELEVSDPLEDLDNPRTGRKSIQLYGNGRAFCDRKEELELDDDKGKEAAVKACQNAAEELQGMENKTAAEKLQIYWTTLNVIADVTELDKETKKTLWMDFSVTQLLG